MYNFTNLHIYIFTYFLSEKEECRYLVGNNKYVFILLENTDLICLHLRHFMSCLTENERKR